MTDIERARRWVRWYENWRGSLQCMPVTALATEFEIVRAEGVALVAEREQAATTTALEAAAQVCEAATGGYEFAWQEAIDACHDCAARIRACALAAPPQPERTP